MRALKLKQKFVIVDNLILVGRVQLHKDLHPAPLGGGLWFWDQDKNILYLYGTSHDFGSVTQAQVDNAIVRRLQFKYTKVVFESDPSKELIDILTQHMNSRRATSLIESNDFL